MDKRRRPSRPQLQQNAIGITAASLKCGVVHSATTAPPINAQLKLHLCLFAAPMRLQPTSHNSFITQQFTMKSTFDLIGVPDQIAAVIFTLSLILSLAPYFSGVDFGVVKIPILDDSSRKRLRLIGPIFLVGALGMFVPVWGTATAAPDDLDQLAKEIAGTEAKLKSFDGLDEIAKRLSDLRTLYKEAQKAFTSDAPDRVAEQSMQLLSQLEAFELTDREQRLADEARSQSEKTFNIFPEEVYTKVCRLSDSLVARRNSLKATLESLQLKEIDLLRRDRKPHSEKPE